LRIATSDLDKFTALKHPKGEIEHDYLRYATADIPEALNGNPCFTINACMRRWGHVFIYDDETLADQLRPRRSIETLRIRRAYGVPTG
jgi:hypothetical protein